MRKTLLISAATAALVVGGAPLAMAAPPEQEMLELECANGETYTVVVNGAGDFTPGRVVDSTQVLLPLSFGDFGFRAELPSGEVIEDSMPGEAESKGKGNVAKRNPQPTTMCTFEVSEVLEEEMDGFPAGTELTFSGYVVVQLPGMR